MKKILIIEDQSDMREMLGWHIKILGFTPIMAKLGEEGVAKAVSEVPDLIVVDIMMPGIDGREVTKQIRKHSALKNVPIVAATALSGDSDLKLCMEAGCSTYIIKPFTFRQLEGKLRQYLPTARAS